MVESFFQMFVIYFFMLFVMLFIITGIDLQFNLNKNIVFTTLFKANFYTALLFIAVLICAYLFTFNFLDFGDDVNSYLALTMTFIALYFIKTTLFHHYSIELSYHFLVTVGTLMLLFTPLYFIYSVLKSYGKGFMH